MFHGGATKKAFTYGKRGRTAVAATSDSDANASSVDEEPKLVLPSRAQKVDYSHKNAVSKHADRGTISTPVKKQAARSDTLSKPKASKNLHNDKVTSPAHARASKVSRQKTKLNNVELLHPSPRRVRVDISTLDQTGRAIKYEVRMNKVADNLLQSMIPGSQLKPEPPKASHAPIGHGTPQRTHRRPTAPSYTQKPAPLRVAAPCASKKSRQNETTDATVLDSPDEEVASVFSSSSSTKASPPALPTKRGVRKNPIVISSDESGWERPSAKAHPGSAHQRTFGAPPTQQRSRVFGRPSQSSLEKLPGQSTPRRVSGINRPRQLTPTIDRYSRSSIPSRHSEPRKSESLIESDLDLSLEIAGLDISSSFDDSGLTKEDTLQPKYIHELLDECRQTTPHEFSAFVEAFPLDPVVNPHDIPSRIFVFRKVGEASFSEVFGIGSVVLKIVPLHDESTSDAILTNDETPSPSKASDLVKEITVTRSMADVCGDAFVRLLKAYVVRGKYPSKLLALWDDYEDDNGSENVRPGKLCLDRQIPGVLTCLLADGFPPSQIYAIIVLPNGGADLEHYQFTDAAKTGWRQAYSVFWQVAHALDQAEQKLKFEVSHSSTTRGAQIRAELRTAIASRSALGTNPGPNHEAGCLQGCAGARDNNRLRLLAHGHG
jgi:serine/threonine-protein kinase haspin